MVSQNYPTLPIWINDKYFYLYNFWVQLRDNGTELAEKLKKIKTDILGDDDAHKELFNDYANTIGDLEPLEKAVAFFVMNKCSYSGLTENSTFSVQASRSNFQIGRAHV